MVLWGISDRDYAQVTPQNKRKIEEILESRGSCYYLEGNFYCEYVEQRGNYLERVIIPEHSILYRIGSNVYSMSSADFNQLIRAGQQAVSKIKKQIRDEYEEED